MNTIHDFISYKNHGNIDFFQTLLRMSMQYNQEFSVKQKYNSINSVTLEYQKREEVHPPPSIYVRRGRSTPCERKRRFLTELYHDL